MTEKPLVRSDAAFGGAPGNARVSVLAGLIPFAGGVVAGRPSV